MEVFTWIEPKSLAVVNRVCTDSKVVYCFPGLSRTCKDQIPRFSGTYKTRFWRLSMINSVHKHGCISQKTAHIKSVITVNKPKCNSCCCINVLQWTQNSLASSVTGSWLINNLHQIQYFTYVHCSVTVCTMYSMYKKFNGCCCINCPCTGAGYFPAASQMPEC